MGLTVTVAVSVGPVQAPKVGVITTVDTCTAVTAAAVSLMLPVPEAGMPVLVLLLVHVKVAPGLAFANKSSKMGAPPQTARFAGFRLTSGLGSMVMSNVTGMPVHKPNVGVTVIRAVCWVVTPAALNTILPVPEAGSPMAGLLLVHEITAAPGWAASVTVTFVPPHTVTSAGCVATGRGVTVRVKFWGAPVHPLATGVTVMLPVVLAATLAAVKPMFPLPVAPKPMAVLLFVQLNAGPPLPLKTTSTCSPLHTV